MSPASDALTPVEVLTLAALADRPRYGYELVERIETLSGGRVTVRPGNLYRVIHRLVGRGLAEEVRHAPGQEVDPRRQYFGATEAGRREAAGQLAMYARILEGTPDLGKALGDA